MANGYLSFVIVSDLFFETIETHDDESADVANGDAASEETRTNKQLNRSLHTLLAPSLAPSLTRTPRTALSFRAFTRVRDQPRCVTHTRRVVAHLDRWFASGSN